MHKDFDALIAELTGSLKLDGYQKQQRQVGMDWPVDAMTMIGDTRMKNIQVLLTDVVEKNIDGDFIECGVWRGGACIFARAVLNELRSTKKVYVADSFCGFPQPKLNWDKGATFLSAPELKVSEAIVRDNFKKYGYLDDGVVFVKGYFEDSLQNLKGKFAIIRADGDLFESTINILEYLYPRLSIGGYIIIDDYHAMECCKAAVTQYRQMFEIHESIQEIDGVGVYWQKEKDNGCYTSHDKNSLEISK